jgi:hypothetical protein
MEYARRLGPTQGLVVLLVAGLVFFLIGFFLALSTVSGSTATERTRWEFVPVGDTVAAIDVQTGETYAIDGNSRAWTVLAPALPARAVPIRRIRPICALSAVPADPNDVLDIGGLHPLPSPLIRTVRRPQPRGQTPAARGFALDEGRSRKLLRLRSLKQEVSSR